VRILHLSDSSLPDRRVERSAMSAVKKKFECYFAGPSSKSHTLNRHLFKKSFRVSWSPEVKLHLPYYWEKTKTEIKQIVNQINPRLIHAHDVFAGKMCLEMDFPFVYDSHEYWSQDMPLKLERRGLQILALKHLVARHYGLKLWSKWQKEIVSKTSTLTISQKAVDAINEIGGHATLLPNFPLKSEVEEIIFQKKNRDFSCAYIGSDLTVSTKHRNVDFLPSIFSGSEVGELSVIGDKKLETSPFIRSLGYLPYEEMLNTLTSHHIGLLPWLPHPYHEYCLPNKVADYGHAGLPVIVTSSLSSAVQILGNNCYLIKEPSELLPLLKDLKKKKEQIEQDSKRIVNFASNELIWDKYEDNIFKAYSSVI